MKASKALIAANQRINKRKRQEALANYYSDPNRCKQCGAVIMVKESEPPAGARARKFCSRSCAAIYNNIHYPKRIGESSGNCERCDAEVIYKKYKKSGGYQRKRFCDACIGTVRSELMRERHAQNGTALPGKVEDMTKGDLKEFYGGPSYKIKNLIATHARKVYTDLGKEPACLLCGYEKLFTVAHVLPVASFDDSVPIRVINMPDNLIGLCPNHHEEYDKGLLDEVYREQIMILVQNIKEQQC